MGDNGCLEQTVPRPLASPDDPARGQVKHIVPKDVREPWPAETRPS
jgi:hypothetical protein